MLNDTACAAGIRVEPGSCLANTHGELLSSRLSRLQKSGYRSSGSSGSGCEQQPWQLPSEAEVAAFEAKGRHFLQSRAFLQYPLQVRGITQCAAVSISSNIIDKEVTPVPNYSCLTLIQRHVTLLAALASRLTADGRPASRQHWRTHVTASCTAMVLARCDALLCSSCGPTRTCHNNSRLTHIEQTYQEWSFDVDLAKHTACDVWAFDPTPKSIDFAKRYDPKLSVWEASPCRAL